MAPDKLKSGAKCCFNQCDGRLIITTFSQFAFHLSLSFSVISTNLGQPCCKCCSLSVNVVVNLRFTTNGMCVKSNTHVARTSRNWMSTAWDLYCCLVPQCEALRARCLAFLIRTKWCFTQGVKVVSGKHSQKERAVGAVHCKNEGMRLQPHGWRWIESVVVVRPIHENDQRWTCTWI